MVSHLLNSDSFMNRMRDAQQTFQYLNQGPRTSTHYIQNDGRHSSNFNNSAFAKVMEEKGHASAQAKANSTTTTGTFMNKPNYPSTGISTSYNTMAHMRGAESNNAPAFDFMGYIDAIPSRYILYAVLALLLWKVISK